MEHSDSLGNTALITDFVISNTSTRDSPCFRISKKRLAISLHPYSQAISEFICIIGNVLDKRMRSWNQAKAFLTHGKEGWDYEWKVGGGESWRADSGFCCCCCHWRERTNGSCNRYCSKGTPLNCCPASTQLLPVAKSKAVHSQPLAPSSLLPRTTAHSTCSLDQSFWSIFHKHLRLSTPSCQGRVPASPKEPCLKNLNFLLQS